MVPRMTALWKSFMFTTPEIEFKQIIIFFKHLSLHQLYWYNYYLNIPHSNCIHISLSMYFLQIFDLIFVVFLGAQTAKTMIKQDLILFPHY